MEIVGLVELWRAEEEDTVHVEIQKIIRNIGFMFSFLMNWELAWISRGEEMECWPHESPGQIAAKSHTLLHSPYPYPEEQRDELFSSKDDYAI